MTTWNYRITRQKLIDERTGHEEFEFAIREVYYDDDGNVTMWSEDPVAAHGETWMEMYDDLAKMGRCVGHPIFDVDTEEEIPLLRRRRRTS